MSVKESTVLFGIADLESSRLLRERLRREQLRILASNNTGEFLELARRAVPDVIILDDTLESLGGEMLIRLLRQPCPTARIILLLPPGSHPDQGNLRHLGPVCSLVSPVADMDLAKVVALALQDQGGLASPRPPVVLCVDDDRLFLKSLARILRQRDVVVVSYDDPEEAREAIPVHAPALAFVDVLMPGMNGLDLVSELREEYGEALPVVLLSAKSSDDEIFRGMRAGAKGYVTKPCDATRILQITDEVLGIGVRPRSALPKQFP
ncbi:MAG TPA: response regulator [Planctomycetota bacterium]|nr:response regulator [Planctomycetota bacterium]